MLAVHIVVVLDIEYQIVRSLRLWPISKLQVWDEKITWQTAQQIGKMDSMEWIAWNGQLGIDSLEWTVRNGQPITDSL